MHIGPGAYNINENLVKTKVSSPLILPFREIKERDSLSPV